MRKEYRKLGAFRIPAYLARPMSLRVSPARGGRPVRERVVGAEEEPHDDDEDERDEDRREKELGPLLVGLDAFDDEWPEGHYDGDRFGRPAILPHGDGKSCASSISCSASALSLPLLHDRRMLSNAVETPCADG